MLPVRQELGLEFYASFKRHLWVCTFPKTVYCEQVKQILHTKFNRNKYALTGVRIQRLDSGSIKLEHGGFTKFVEFEQFLLFEEFRFEMESLFKGDNVEELSVDFFALKNFGHGFGKLSFFKIFDNELDLVEFDGGMDFL